MNALSTRTTTYNLFPTNHYHYQTIPRWFKQVFKTDLEEYLHHTKWNTILAGSGLTPKTHRMRDGDGKNASRINRNWGINDFFQY